MTTPLDAGEALRQVDVRTLLRRLALRRPVFHAEADFQQELAWQVHDAHPDWPVRLEVRARIPSRDGHRERVDALIYTPAGGVAVELKYLTDKLDIEIGDELTVVGPDITLQVLGFTYGGSYGHVSIAFTSLETWQNLVYGENHRDRFNAVALRDPGGVDLAAIADQNTMGLYTKTGAYDGSPGFAAESATDW